MLEAYRATDPAALRFFAGTWDTPSIAEAAPRLAQGFTGDRAALVAVLREHLLARQAPDAARAAVEELARPDSVAVLCGQQPAYGGGPLYNLGKAVHALRLAQDLRSHGVPAVAVYWCAAEDHDHDEADHVDLIDRSGRLQRLRCQFPVPGASLQFQSASSGWPTLLAGLEQLPGPQLGADWLRAQAPRAEESLPDWVVRLLDQLFGDAGLIVIQTQALRPLWAPIWPTLNERWPSSALKQRSAELDEEGVALAFPDLSQPPVFTDLPSGRQPVSAFAELDTRLLSPGAALRPVLQQIAFPCVAYCGGPGEIRYHAQIGPLYEALGVLAPRLVPRWRLRLLPGWWRRAVASWELSPRDFFQSLPVARADQQSPTVEETQLDELASRIDQLRSDDPDLAKRLRTGADRLRRELNKLQASLARGRRRRAGRQALGELFAWLHPHGQPQERTLSLAQALWHWGPGLARDLLHATHDDGCIDLALDTIADTIADTTGP